MTDNQLTTAKEAKTATPSPSIFDGLNSKYARRRFMKSQGQQCIDPIHELLKGVSEQTRNELITALIKADLERSGLHALSGWITELAAAAVNNKKAETEQATPADLFAFHHLNTPTNKQP